jgi:hypothetical protein
LDRSQSNSVVIRDVYEIELTLDLMTAGKAPCLHLSQIGISIVKKLKERALSLQGKLPAPSILREFCFEIWERESAPADYCLI